jgi:hypothetical protein
MMMMMMMMPWLVSRICLKEPRELQKVSAGEVSLF